MTNRFGQLIRELREMRGWSQKDLADRVGTDRGEISHWERGTRKVSLEVAARLAHALDFRLSRLIDDVESKTTSLQQ